MEHTKDKECVLHGASMLHDASYIYSLQVQNKESGKYWNIDLKENEENAKIVRNKIWKNTDKEISIEISTNRKYCIITIPKPQEKTYTASINEIKPATPEQIENIKHEKDIKENVKKLHELFKELEIEFEIDDPYYAEDHTYVQVYHKGKLIHSGVEVDLHNIKPKGEK